MLICSIGSFGCGWEITRMRLPTSQDDSLLPTKKKLVRLWDRSSL